MKITTILSLLILSINGSDAFAPSAAKLSINHALRTHPVGTSTAAASQLFRRKDTNAFMSQKGESYDEEQDSLIVDTATTLKRLGWISWWSQVILSVVSSVTLLFARSVLKAEANKGAITGGFFLAGSGLACSFLSIIWTWGSSRLSKRLRKNGVASYSRIKAANMIRRTITVGALLNLAGIFFALIGAQQIVGLLAAKLLTMQGVNPLLNAASVSAQTLQPIDLLIVQANTNTLLSHFISLVCCLIMTRGIDNLDPPSIEDDPR